MAGELSPGVFAGQVQQGVGDVGGAIGQMAPLDPYRKKLGEVHSKWLTRALNGEMSFEEAATRAKLEAHGHPGAYNGLQDAGHTSPSMQAIQSGAADMRQQLGIGAGGAAPSAPMPMQAPGPNSVPPPPTAPPSPGQQPPQPPAPTPMMNQGGGAPPSAPSMQAMQAGSADLNQALDAIPAPQTAFDYSNLDAFSDKMRPPLMQLSAERRLEARLGTMRDIAREKEEGKNVRQEKSEEGKGTRLEIQEAGKAERQGVSEKGKKERSAAALAQQRDAMRLKHQEAMARLANQLEATRKSGSMKDVKLLESELKDLNTVRGERGKLLSSMGEIANDPGIKTEMVKLDKEVEDATARVEEARKVVKAKMGQGPSSQSARIKAQVGALPGAPSAEDLNKLFSGGS